MCKVKYGVRCELFSYGVVLLELLTGKLQGQHVDDEGNLIRLEDLEVPSLEPDARAGVWNDECADLLRTVAIKYDVILLHFHMRL